MASTFPLCHSTILPVSPCASKSTAALPKAVATKRSNAEGIPPLDYNYAGRRFFLQHVVLRAYLKKN